LSTEEHSPYHSKSLRVNSVESPKDFVGMLSRRVEITYGNQEIKVIRNKEDIADIVEEKTIIDELDALWMESDEWAKKRGKTFIDNIPKEES